MAGLALAASKSFPVEADSPDGDVGFIRQLVGRDNADAERIDIQGMAKMQRVDDRRDVKHKGQTFARMFPILHASHAQTEQSDVTCEVLRVFARLRSFRQIDINA